MVFCAALAALAACSPTIGDAPPGIRGSNPADAGDEPLPPRVDAEPIELPDAGAGEVALVQTRSEEILDDHSIACVEMDDNNNPVQNRENSYYRVFDLAEADVQGTLEVSSVRVGVESAQATDGLAQPGEVRLYTLDGEFLIANLDLVNSVEIQIEPQTQSRIDVPITGTFAPGSTLVVELFIPDSSEGRLFFIGSNNLGETAPSYLRAPAAGCDFIEPTRFADVGPDFDDIAIVLSVRGTES
jgi:hypothetical protein